MKQLKFFVSVLMIFSIVACGSKYEDYKIDDSGKRYFPLEVGNTWTYSVDSIIYDNQGLEVDTFHYTIKEVVTDSFVDGAGETNYTISRYKKDGENWVENQGWYGLLTEKHAIRIEDNLRFIKMIFPVQKDVCWDGNSFIDSENIIVKIAGEPIKMYDNWRYGYVQVDTSLTINGIEYNSVHTVVECDTENRLNRRFSEAKYAENVGLVYRKMIILDTQNSSNTEPWEEKAEQGFILEQSLLSFKK